MHGVRRRLLFYCCLMYFLAYHFLYVFLFISPLRHLFCYACICPYSFAAGVIFFWTNSSVLQTVTESIEYHHHHHHHLKAEFPFVPSNVELSIACLTNNSPRLIKSIHGRTWVWVTLKLTNPRPQKSSQKKSLAVVFFPNDLDCHLTLRVDPQPKNNHRIPRVVSEQVQMCSS